MTEALELAPPRGHVAKRFLEPSSVAIVGVSTSSGQAYKAGGRAVLEHLRVYGYAGEVMVIHPSATDVDGYPALRSLSDAATVPDVVVIAVPADAVLGVLEQCAAVGARQALILTAGFADMGAAGHALERTLLDYAKQNGINVVGPNSTGLVNVRTGLAMSMTSVLTEGVPITAGGIAVIAQSGAIGSTVVERARDAGVGISHIVSTGNQRDMDIPDFISYFADLPEVHTVALYMESIRDGRRFAAAVEQLHDAGKRLITYLGGRTAAGEQAAASHTGKIIGRGALELALLRALDVTVVDDPDDLWVLGAMTAPPRRQFPRRWGMVAYSGGMAVLATEQLAGAGVVFPPLGTSTTQHLKALLPSFAAIPNPLDVGPGSMPRHFGGYLAAVAEDPAVEAVCVPLPMGARGWNTQSVADILAVRRATGKPCVVLWYGGRAVDPYIKELREAGVLVAQSPSDLGRLVRALLGPQRVLDDSTPTFAGEPATRAGTIGGAQALQLLADYGLDVAAMTVCDSGSAAAAAEALGYPVVVKSADEDIAHRTERGLVAVNLSDAAKVEDAVARMAAGSPGANPTWLVQKMVTGGVELILTVRTADDLGVFGTVGVGGAAVEVHRDVEHVPLPCDAATLHKALTRLRLAELIFGFRGSEPVDEAWIGDTLNRMAVLLAEQNLAEVEVNPAIADKNGGTIVDALCVRAAAPALVDSPNS
ncbi:MULTISPECIES: acetate--CoA ligase family protein [Mycobacterium avium complex (MAC)]|uniref:Acyl-CoA synthetase (NDP forming) n=2 Tax=Mycobacterium avium complex (MAC) TaxID=120793 RepID=A0ABX3SBJ7_MYCBC|nr:MULTISPECIES: acetate--CoA ligase family protein [Mycobacterium avium complex (MAC)]MCA2292788.1 acetate--CoA ligase family protein [Mycobacterium avium]ORA47405.1 acyl-CoA synthetase (NDP forming) [Mycobacterium bouchedurhonense]BCO39257.1 pimeloyl-CoA synthetase [Mycobacterium paraintracellulare]